MIIGNPEVFAIESHIEIADKNLGIRGIGFFVIHIQNIEYGIRKDDATALACSLDEVKDRIRMRNMHVSPFSNFHDPSIIAKNVISALFGSDKQESEEYFGLQSETFSNLIYENRLLWAPDGDEAFDDGSYIIQFDFEENVRLIGFKNTEDEKYNKTTLSDLWINGEEFYDILNKWHIAFEHEWIELIK